MVRQEPCVPARVVLGVPPVRPGGQNEYTRPFGWPAASAVGFYYQTLLFNHIFHHSLIKNYI
jgi:hypothetical protein